MPFVRDFSWFLTSDKSGNLYRISSQKTAASNDTYLPCVSAHSQLTIGHGFWQIFYHKATTPWGWYASSNARMGGTKGRILLYAHFSPSKTIWSTSIHQQSNSTMSGNEIRNQKRQTVNVVQNNSLMHSRYQVDTSVYSSQSSKCFSRSGMMSCL